MRVVLDCSLAVVVFDRLLGFGHDGRKRRVGGSFEQANPEQSGDAKLRDPRGWPSCRRGFLVLLAARSPRLDFAPHAFEGSHFCQWWRGAVCDPRGGASE